jgi:hypothetical protein
MARAVGSDSLGTALAAMSNFAEACMTRTLGELGETQDTFALKAAMFLRLLQCDGAQCWVPTWASDVSADTLTMNVLLDAFHALRLQVLCCLDDAVVAGVQGGLAARAALFSPSVFNDPALARQCLALCVRQRVPAAGPRLHRTPGPCPRDLLVVLAIVQRHVHSHDVAVLLHLLLLWVSGMDWSGGFDVLGDGSSRTIRGFLYEGGRDGLGAQVQANTETFLIDGAGDVDVMGSLFRDASAATALLYGRVACPVLAPGVGDARVKKASKAHGAVAPATTVNPLRAVRALVAFVGRTNGWFVEATHQAILAEYVRLVTGLLGWCPEVEMVAPALHDVWRIQSQWAVFQCLPGPRPESARGRNRGDPAPTVVQCMEVATLHALMDCLQKQRCVPWSLAPYENKEGGAGFVAVAMNLLEALLHAGDSRGRKRPPWPELSLSQVAGHVAEVARALASCQKARRSDVENVETPTFCDARDCIPGKSCFELGTQAHVVALHWLLTLATSVQWLLPGAAKAVKDAARALVELGVHAMKNTDSGSGSFQTLASVLISAVLAKWAAHGPGVLGPIVVAWPWVFSKANPAAEKDEQKKTLWKTMTEDHCVQAMRACVAASKKATQCTSLQASVVECVVCVMSVGDSGQKVRSKPFLFPPLGRLRDVCVDILRAVGAWTARMPYAQANKLLGIACLFPGDDEVAGTAVRTIVALVCPGWGIDEREHTTWSNTRMWKAATLFHSALRESALHCLKTIVIACGIHGLFGHDYATCDEVFAKIVDKAEVWWGNFSGWGPNFVRGSTYVLDVEGDTLVAWVYVLLSRCLQQRRLHPATQSLVQVFQMGIRLLPDVASEDRQRWFARDEGLVYTMRSWDLRFQRNDVDTAFQEWATVAAGVLVRDVT